MIPCMKILHRKGTGRSTKVSVLFDNKATLVSWSWHERMSEEEVCIETYEKKRRNWGRLEASMGILIPWGGPWMKISDENNNVAISNYTKLLLYGAKQ